MIHADENGPTTSGVRRAGGRLALGALAAVARLPPTSYGRAGTDDLRRAVFFVMALSFASVNGWWCVSNFRGAVVESSSRKGSAPSHLSVLSLLRPPTSTFSSRGRKAPGGQPPDWECCIRLAIAGWAAVLFEVIVALTLGMTGNTRPGRWAGRTCTALTGRTCGLATDVPGRGGPQRRHP